MSPNPQVAPGERPATSFAADTIQPTNGSAIDQFFDGIDPLVADYGTALSNLRSTIKKGLDPAAIAEAECADLPYIEGGDREYRREIEGYFRYCREECVFLIMHAKNDAQLVATIDDPAKISEVQASVVANTLQADPASGSKASELREAKLWLSVFEAEKNKMDLERKLFNKTVDLLEQNPTNIVKVLMELTEGDRDPDEYRPYLEFLANNHFDPSDASLTTAAIDALSSTPEAYKRNFLTSLDECYSEDEVTREQRRAEQNPDILSWLDFMQTRFQVEGGLATPSTVLLDVDFAMWPEPMQRALLEEYSIVISEMRKTFTEALTPYKDPSNFYILGDDFKRMVEQRNQRRGGNRSVSPRKRQKAGRGSRVTKSVKTESFVESKIERPQAVDAITALAKTPNGYVTNGTTELTDELEEADLDSTILGLKPVASYISEMAGDNQVKDDVLAMVKSLIDEPRFNGADKMTDAKISVKNGGTQNTKIAIWHLNPNKRSDLSIGDVARQTRIYYIMTTSESGKKVLAILSVAHKNSAEKLRGGWLTT